MLPVDDASDVAKSEINVLLGERSGWRTVGACSSFALGPK